MNDNGRSISFSKEGLAASLENFQSIRTNISNEIDKITASLEVIDRNWTGPEHDSASKDKTNAEENMKKAKNITDSMNETLETIERNANKISYN